MTDRKAILLRAAFDLIRRSIDDGHVAETASIVTRYDDANCDGHCLMEDIAFELGIDTETTPLPLEPEES